MSSEFEDAVNAQIEECPVVKTAKELEILKGISSEVLQRELKAREEEERRKREALPEDVWYAHFSNYQDTSLGYLSKKQSNVLMGRSTEFKVMKLDRYLALVAELKKYEDSLRHVVFYVDIPRKDIYGITETINELQDLRILLKDL